MCYVECRETRKINKLCLPNRIYRRARNHSEDYDNDRMPLFLTFKVHFMCENMAFSKYELQENVSKICGKVMMEKSVKLLWTKFRKI